VHIVVFIAFAKKLLSDVAKLQQLTVNIYLKTVFRFMRFIVMDSPCGTVETNGQW
jgi:hypothetical protein